VSAIAIRLRPVEDPDFAAIAALTNVYINTTVVHFGYEPVKADELRDAWRAKRTLYPYLVAVDDHGDFLGYAKAGPWRERAAYQWSVETGIYVVERAHGCGVGRTLYAALIDACRERGFHSAIGGITMPNDASVRLHEALGFQQIATFRQAGWKFGAWHDVAFFQLTLRDGSHVAAAL